MKATIKDGSFFVQLPLTKDGEFIEIGRDVYLADGTNVEVEEISLTTIGCGSEFNYFISTDYSDRRFKPEELYFYSPVDKDTNEAEIKTLADTVELMCSDSYKDRFIAEYAQTKLRLDSLTRILDKYDNNTLDFEFTCPVTLLAKQKIQMKIVLRKLKERAEIENIELPKVGE